MLFKLFRKLKMGYTPDKSAAEYGFKLQMVYKLSKDDKKFAQYRIDNPYSSIRKTFKFSDFPSIKNKAFK